jgi:hypothetical protein
MNSSRWWNKCRDRPRSGKRNYWRVSAPVALCADGFRITRRQTCRAAAKRGNLLLWQHRLSDSVRFLKPNEHCWGDTRQFASWRHCDRNSSGPQPTRIRRTVRADHPPRTPMAAFSAHGNKCRDQPRTGNSAGGIRFDRSVIALSPGRLENRKARRWRLSIAYSDVLAALLWNWRHGQSAGGFHWRHCREPTLAALRLLTRNRPASGPCATRAPSRRCAPSPRSCEDGEGANQSGRKRNRPARIE